MNAPLDGHQHLRWEVLMLAWSRSTSTAAALADAAQIERFILHGGMENGGMENGGMESIRTAPPVMPNPEMVPLAPSADPTLSGAGDTGVPGEVSGIAELVFAELERAVKAGHPCPTNRELESRVKAPRHSIVRAMGELQRANWIEVDSRGSIRRVGIAGQWTPWRGTASEEPAVSAPAGALHPEPEPEPTAAPALAPIATTAPPAPAASAPPIRPQGGIQSAPKGPANGRPYHPWRGNFSERSGPRDVPPHLRQLIEERVASGNVEKCPPTVVLESTFGQQLVGGGLLPQAGGKHG